jgi:2-C-methyl-D-erythritol 2,4-cyclodiphosphate synthase
MSFARIGHGYDVHRFDEGRKLYLCGVEISYERGLLGHSDADVAIHALIDALLGAAALGDIGALFPDNDEYYKGIRSTVLLRSVANLLSEKGYELGNADVTVIAERPKLRPYIEEMRATVAECLACDVTAVSIKATTEEGLGFTGEGKGIAAHAVVLLLKK